MGQRKLIKSYMSLASLNLLSNNLLKFFPILAKFQDKHWEGQPVCVHQGAKRTRSTI